MAGEQWGWRQRRVLDGLHGGRAAGLAAKMGPMRVRACRLSAGLHLGNGGLRLWRDTALADPLTLPGERVSAGRLASGVRPSANPSANPFVREHRTTVPLYGPKTAEINQLRTQVPLITQNMRLFTVFRGINGSPVRNHSFFPQNGFHNGLSVRYMTGYRRGWRQRIELEGVWANEVYARNRP